MVLMREGGTCHGRNGLIRYAFAFYFAFSYCPVTFERFIELHTLIQVGLKGEALSLHSLSGSSSVEWIQGSLVTRRQPLTWYKVSKSNFN